MNIVSITDPIVEISNLCYSKDGNDILHDINLTVNKGDLSP